MILLEKNGYELITGGWVSCCWVPKRDDAGWSENCMSRCNALKLVSYQEVELFTIGWVSCCWVPKNDHAGWNEKCMPRCNAVKNGHLPERKGWALYRMVSELLLSPKEGWRWMKWKLHAEVQRPKKRESFREEELRSSPEGEWVVAEPQRGMMQDKVKLVCRCATPWKMDIFLRGRVKLFAGRWVSWCWVSKRDEAENEKNDYMKDEENRKVRYKHLVWYNLMHKKDFSFSAKDL